MYTHIVIHYGEIGTKKGNRHFFEKALIRNIKRKLNEERIRRGYGRIIIELSQNSNIEKIKSSLLQTFGIANFAPSIRAESNLDDIIEKSISLAKENEFNTFRISSRRLNKNFPLTSLQINEIVGSAICDLGKKVDLSSPEMEITIEVANKSAYIYHSVFQGLGGLPVGVSGKVISLISGGIDSPVASYLAMKRGCKCIFVHFHNYTLYRESVKEKIINIAKILSKYNGHTILYLVPFEEIQKEIIRKIPAEYRMLSYRRAMLCISEKIREKEDAKAFVTGDNLAQVASQTLDNLCAVYSSAKRPVIAPLIGFDKKDIIKIAENIGTYEISILPYNDCCSSFIAEHPATKCNIEELEEMEKEVDIEVLSEKSLKTAEIIHI